VRLLQPVERLGGHAHEELDADEEEDHRRRPGVARAAHGGRTHLGQRGAAFGTGAPLEARLGHEQEAEEPGRDGDRTADDHARAQRQDPDRDLQDEPQDGTDVRDTGTSQEHPSDLVGADLIGDPGLFCAARERVREPPETPKGDDEPRRRDDAHEHPGRAHAHVPDDQRQPAAVRVGDDTRWNLEQEHGGLHRSPHEHELERRQVQLLHEVDGHDDPGRHGDEDLQRVVEPRRVRASQGPCSSGSVADIVIPTSRYS